MHSPRHSFSFSGSFPSSSSMASAASDGFSDSPDFKLCGFLPFVASVVSLPSRSPRNASSRSRSFEPQEEPGAGESDGFLPSDGSSFYSRRRDRKGSHGCDVRRHHQLLSGLLGAECWLTGEGSEVQFYTSGGFILSPVLSLNEATSKEVRLEAMESKDVSCATASSFYIEVITDGAEESCIDRSSESCIGQVVESHISPSLESHIDPATASPDEHSKVQFSYPTSSSHKVASDTSSKKRKRNGINDVDDGTRLLSSLQLLVVRNGVKVNGHVVRVSCGKGRSETRALVLLDLYLPSFLWTGRNYWKPNHAFTAVMNHLSCDWEDREKSLELSSQGRIVEPEASSDMWRLGSCQVLGCNLHTVVGNDEKRTRFNMHAIFKSIPSLQAQKMVSTRIFPRNGEERGLWDIPDEVLTSILCKLPPRDLQIMACTCRHIRELAMYIMPCMHLKLFPHQQAAVCWMLQRELHPSTVPHPLCKDLQAKDGLHFYLNLLSGELSLETPPLIRDFQGGLFCDEPGLGKTVTALSLILKTQGTLATAPDGTHVNWCQHRSGDRYGYYEISSNRVTSVLKRSMDLKAKQNKLDSTPPRSVALHHEVTAAQSLPARKRRRELVEFSLLGKPVRRLSLDMGPSTRSSNAVKRKLSEVYESLPVDTTMETCGNPDAEVCTAVTAQLKKKDIFWKEDVWVQCDACSKWRKMEDGATAPGKDLAWFCNMNKDPMRQSCTDPEESWESGVISTFPGFHKAGDVSGLEQNVIHFATVLKECATPRSLETENALSWLANLSPEKLEKMSSIGLSVPASIHTFNFHVEDQRNYQLVFQKFGLIPKKERKGVIKWHYPPFLDNLVFDLPALQDALSKPLDVFRIYLSRATLIVVPANLVDHWKNQILRHTKHGQLRVCVLIDQKHAPKVQDLAWNFDVVITTFSRLSCEWSYKENSVLMAIHWLRIILDEGHTLGASLSLTNKLQMAISMHASRRWVLTGTPTPNTPNSQVAHLQPILKFLHEEVYGCSQKSWEAGILKPFEAGREEGHARLIQLLHRCMISSRKSDLCTIPPCVRKITLLDFTPKHAESYNELVATVRRNILMADWNDPSHVESLLNPKQWKFRSTTIRNVRLSCCVAGQIKVENAGEDIQETMDILVQEGLDPLSWEHAVIKNALQIGGDCSRCQDWCRLPIITPCKHLLCLDCVALDRYKCTFPGCGTKYKMQSPEDMTRPENPNPKWPVPQDLIELQPSYVQDTWNPDWQATSSSKVAYLIQKLKSLKGISINCSLGQEKDGVHRMMSFDDVLQQQEPAEKAIVFSQFLEHIHVIESQLTKSGIRVAPMYSPMHSANKMKSLLSFQNDSDCSVLLMDGSAALGLDLSFVTHVYLMEPIWDRSMEEQVVSRAHRMGATRPILVETLGMRGTIEEQMLQFLQDTTEQNKAILQGYASDNGRNGQRTVHDFAESSYLVQLSHVSTKNTS